MTAGPPAAAATARRARPRCRERQGSGEREGRRASWSPPAGRRCPAPRGEGHVEGRRPSSQISTCPSASAGGRSAATAGLSHRGLAAGGRRSTSTPLTASAERRGRGPHPQARRSGRRSRRAVEPRPPPRAPRRPRSSRGGRAARSRSAASNRRSRSAPRPRPHLLAAGPRTGSPQLLPRPPAVGAHRRGVDAERCADLAVAHPLDHGQVHDRPLPRREQREQALDLDSPARRSDRGSPGSATAASGPARPAAAPAARWRGTRCAASRAGSCAGSRNAPSLSPGDAPGCPAPGPPRPPPRPPTGRAPTSRAQCRSTSTENARSSPCRAAPTNSASLASTVTTQESPTPALRVRPPASAPEVAPPHPFGLEFRSRPARGRAAIAQLDRATDYGSVGWGFDSSWLHHFFPLSRQAFGPPGASARGGALPG